MSGRPYLTRIQWLESAIKRFWSKVDRGDAEQCWMWNGTRMMPNKIGVQYGSFGVYDGKSVSYRAHRFAYMLVYGEIPDGQVIMHTCDNTLCVNPAHLKAGTQLENAQDMKRKDRVAHGSSHYDSRLSENQVLEIFDNKSDSDSFLGKRHGVDPSNIRKIRRGINWKRLLRAHGRIPPRQVDTVPAGLGQ
jgi:hypothetical protein